MKKAILLSGILALSVFCGCSASEKSQKNTEDIKKEETKGEKSIVAKLTQSPKLSPKVTETSGEEKKSEDKSGTEKKTALSPTPTPTSLPVPTMSPDEGTISKPDHPETVTNDKLIFVGDSRTEGIRDAVKDDSIWSCLSSMGYDWMVSTGVPQIEDEIEDNTAVIILMGVNDVYHLNDYIQYINTKAKEWTDLGATTYFVSVGPVEKDPYVTNEQIESFNAAMEANLIGVNYIDVYSHLLEVGYSTVDGTHYPDNVSAEIYNYILDNLEETTSGIWG